MLLGKSEGHLRIAPKRMKHLEQGRSDTAVDVWITIDHRKFLIIWEYWTTRPPYLSPEKPVYGSRSNRNLDGMTDWFKIGKGICQGYILSPCLFNFYAKYIMVNARLDESQAGVKTARRNINNLRYADDTTLMAESKEELKSLLMRVKEESEKPDLKLSVKKTKVPSLHGK